MPSSSKIDWRIYYGDRSTFSNEDGAPQDAPAGNVQYIAYYDQDNRRKLCHQRDYYIFDLELKVWYGVDLVGLMQYLGEPGYKVVKFGRMMGDLYFRELSSWVMNDLPVEGSVR